MNTAAKGAQYGYQYSPANKAYEIAPIDSDGELDWNNELCITAGDGPADEWQAKMIVRAVNSHADLLEALEALRGMCSPFDSPSKGAQYEWNDRLEKADNVISKAKSGGRAI